MTKIKSHYKMYKNKPFDKLEHATCCEVTFRPSTPGSTR